MPTHIGRYRIDRPLGEGGLGAVYLAHDPHLDRPVVLRVPNRDADKGRFLRDARAVTALRHRNICPLYDFGTADGAPFLCFAYIRGEPLSRKVGHGRPLPVVEAVAIVRTVARAMHEAHRQGITHCGLTPANIMIDEAGQPVVLDLGLARPPTLLASRFPGNDEDDDDDEVGTPDYMPPEQLRGFVRLGPASDIYSLGFILYELLTGEWPFDDPFFGRAFNSDADPPSLPSRHRPGLDQRLDLFCLQALATHPDDRWVSMAAFADVLDDVLRGESAAPVAALLLRIAGTPYACRADPRRDVMTLGRPGEGNDIALHVTGDDDLSLRIRPRHLEIRRTPAGYVVTDPDGTGTLLNGQPLPPGAAVSLAHGDRLSVAGVLTLKVLLDSPAAGGTLPVVELPTADGTGRIMVEVATGELVTLG